MLELMLDFINFLCIFVGQDMVIREIVTVKVINCIPEQWRIFISKLWKVYKLQLPSFCTCKSFYLSQNLLNRQESFFDVAVSGLSLASKSSTWSSVCDLEARKVFSLSDPLPTEYALWVMLQIRAIPL